MLSCLFYLMKNCEEIDLESFESYLSSNPGLDELLVKENEELDLLVKAAPATTVL